MTNLPETTYSKERGETKVNETGFPKESQNKEIRSGQTNESGAEMNVYNIKRYLSII